MNGYIVDNFSGEARQYSLTSEPGLSFEEPGLAGTNLLYDFIVPDYTIQSELGNKIPTLEKPIEESGSGQSKIGKGATKEAETEEDIEKEREEQIRRVREALKNPIHVEETLLAPKVTKPPSQASGSKEPVDNKRKQTVGSGSTKPAKKSKSFLNFSYL
jgi:hypothetical protein